MNLKLVAALMFLSVCLCSCKVRNNNSSDISAPNENANTSNDSSYNESSGNESSENNSSEDTSAGNESAEESFAQGNEASGSETMTRAEITVVDGITYVNGILIANKTYSLPASYNPGKILDEAYNAFLQMKNAAAKDGVDLFIQSGFRSYYEQNAIYNNYVNIDGKAEADRYSARPGHSEHQTGLAMDLNMLYTSFGQTKEGIWLKNNCHKYGFIIRYPEGKEHITGYMYEPWHIRYLGKDIATAVYESGLCLEEYLGITSKYAK